MKKLLLITVCLLPLWVFGQKLEKPEIDKFTGDTTLSTKDEIYSSSITFTGADVLRVSVKKIKGIYLLSCYLSSNTGKHSDVYSISEGNKAYLKLDDNSIISLDLVHGQMSDIRYSNAGKISSCMGFYRLTNTIMDKLQNHKIESIRIETSKENFDYDANKSKKDLIQKMLVLILRG